MKDSSNIRTESDFFQWLKGQTEDRIFWERIEPKTEGGFPDTHFVIKGHFSEGTAELKVCSTKYPNLSSLLRPSQQVNFIDYDKAGGRNRFTLVFNKTDLKVYGFSTEDVVLEILSSETEAYPFILNSFAENFSVLLSLNLGV